MPSKREPHNPLQGRSSWQQGTAPDHTPAPPPETQQDAADDMFARTGPPTIANGEWMATVRVARSVRAALGGPWGDRHDRLAQRYLQMLREGKELPRVSQGCPWQPDMVLRPTFRGLPLN
jgi:hypothetical protein